MSPDNYPFVYACYPIVSQAQRHSEAGQCYQPSFQPDVPV